MTRDKADLAVFRALHESFCSSYRSPKKFMPCDTVVEKGLIFCSLQCSCHCRKYVAYCFLVTSIKDWIMMFAAVYERSRLLSNPQTPEKIVDSLFCLEYEFARALLVGITVWMF